MISVSYEMLKHLNVGELTSPMKYKERCVCSLQEHVENAHVQSTHISLMFFSHFVTAFRFVQPNPAKEQESGQKIHISLPRQRKVHTILSSLQLLSITIFLVLRSYLYLINTSCLPMRFTSTVYIDLFFCCLVTLKKRIYFLLLQQFQPQ